MLNAIFALSGIRSKHGLSCIPDSVCSDYNDTMARCVWFFLTYVDSADFTIISGFWNKFSSSPVRRTSIARTVRTSIAGTSTRSSSCRGRSKELNIFLRNAIVVNGPPSGPREDPKWFHRSTRFYSVDWY